MALKGWIIAGTALATAALAPAAALAANLLQNGGFEDGFSYDPGSPDHWDKHASGDWGDLITTRMVANFFLQPGQPVVTGPYSNEADDPDGNPVAITYHPPEGWQFAALESGDQDDFTTISQSFVLSGRGVFSGFAAFFGGDYKPYSDEGYVKIIREDDGSEISLFAPGIGALGDHGYTPWTQMSLNLGPGAYRFQAGVVNRGDGDNSSWLILDGLSVASVPEPAAWTLMIAGFGGLGLVLRRRRAQAAA